jgi:hypothetical protein
MKPYIVSTLALGFVAAATLTLPALAAAQTETTTTSSSNVQSILAQIHALQLQLKNGTMKGSDLDTSENMMGTTTPMMGTSTPPGMGKKFCLGLTHTLSRGSRGTEVSDLQKSLAEDSSIYPEGKVTGFFGPATAAAVMRMQAEIGVASSTTATGTVGPKTRELLRNRCLMAMPMHDKENDNGTTDNHMMMGSTSPWTMGSSTRPHMDDDSHMGSTTMQHMMPGFPLHLPETIPSQKIGSTTIMRGPQEPHHMGEVGN